MAEYRPIALGNIAACRRATHQIVLSLPNPRSRWLRTSGPPRRSRWSRPLGHTRLSATWTVIARLVDRCWCYCWCSSF